MIEKKIDELIKAMAALTEAINNQTPQPTKTVKEDPQPETQPETGPEPEPETEETEEPITIAQLTDICLAKVRSNDKNKAKIKKIIKSFGGELIKDIDEDKYPELKQKLEAL